MGYVTHSEAYPCALAPLVRRPVAKARRFPSRVPRRRPFWLRHGVIPRPGWRQKRARHCVESPSDTRSEALSGALVIHPSKCPRIKAATVSQRGERRGRSENSRVR
jgi:hypothetical protein